jgi:hypothetical protein
VIRGTVPLRVECAPAFNYARDPHTTTILPDESSPYNQNKVLFKSKSLSLDLRFVSGGDHPAQIDLKELDFDAKGHLGRGAYCDLSLKDGECVTFVLRIVPEYERHPHTTPTVSKEKADELGVPLERELTLVLFKMTFERCLFCLS